MGRIKPPADIIEKRDILHGGDTPKDALVAYGDYFLEKGAVHDALSFYMRADHRPGIEKMLEVAEREGEVFIIQRIERSHRIEVPAEVWKRTAESAEKLSKWRYALIGYEHCGDEDRANAIRVKLGIAVEHKVLPGTEIVDPSASP